MLHVDLPSRDDIATLMNSRGEIKVSIYLPTTPFSQQAQQDRIVLKNLTKTAIDQLAERPKKDVEAIEGLLLDLVDDGSFWEYQAHGLAIFVTPTQIHTLRLPYSVQELVEVSDRFHVKPLLHPMAASSTGFVLVLGQNNVKLLQICSDLPAVTLNIDGLPKDAASSVGKSSIQDRSPSGRIQGDEGKKVRLTQYARLVDQALRPVLNGRSEPLILAATEPLLSIYRQLATYPFLAAEEIRHSPDAISDVEIVAAARTIFQNLASARIQSALETFEQRKTQNRTTTNLEEISVAATQGAVQSLIVDVARVTPGTIDEHGKITPGAANCPVSYDVVGEICARVMMTGGTVLAAGGEQVPGTCGLAATLRYAPQ
ncbi:conserved hypothetical protein [Planctopirus limnophila DSM 3776]|uniref:Uncharacterized protein n=1 Tax=Planctopirus limnophila (strain ATCC 43296 / DSM 3776 / IFAM 1008 / Mu 290) TaxID=521674 RepID=D5SY57_PLAL2|nr:hypothetical protein [Planctopirus limnophila]ADG69850.1 conserved hypothetical protein [Planctopirus limnophila DSM 3776]